MIKQPPPSTKLQNPSGILRITAAKRESKAYWKPQGSYALASGRIKGSLYISKMNHGMLQDENNDALDWVSEEEDLQFGGGEQERKKNKPTPLHKAPGKHLLVRSSEKSHRYCAMCRFFTAEK